MLEALFITGVGLVDLPTAACSAFCVTVFLPGVRVVGTTALPGVVTGLTIFGVAEVVAALPTDVSSLKTLVFF